MHYGPGAGGVGVTEVRFLVRCGVHASMNSAGRAFPFTIEPSYVRSYLR